MAKQKQAKVVKDKKERSPFRTLEVGNISDNLLTKLARWAQLAATMDIADLEALDLLWSNASDENIKFVQKYLKEVRKKSPIALTTRVIRDFLEPVSMREFIQVLFRIGLSDCADQLPKAPEVSDEPPF